MERQWSHRLDRLDQGEREMHHRSHLGRWTVAEISRPLGQHLQQHVHRVNVFRILDTHRERIDREYSIFVNNFQGCEFRKRRDEQGEESTDRRLGESAGRGQTLQEERREMGSRWRRELRRGLVPWTRSPRAETSRRPCHYRQELRPYPRDQPEETRTTAPDFRQSQRLRQDPAYRQDQSSGIEHSGAWQGNDFNKDLTDVDHSVPE